MFELQSNEINEIAVALNKFQAELVPAIKDKENPYFKSKYADLTEVWSVCREPLSKNGLSVVQGADTFEGKNYLVTTLIHNSGQWIRSRYELLPVKNDPQALGSSVSYARRYMLSSLLGVTAEDDDGNAAMSLRDNQKEKELEEKAKQAAQALVSVVESEIDACNTVEGIEAFVNNRTEDLKFIRQYIPQEFTRLKTKKDDHLNALQNQGTDKPVDLRAEGAEIIKVIQESSTMDFINSYVDEKKEVTERIKLEHKDLYEQIKSAYQAKTQTGDQ